MRRARGACRAAEHSKQAAKRKQRFNVMMSSKKFMETRMMRFVSSMLADAVAVGTVGRGGGRGEFPQ